MQKVKKCVFEQCLCWRQLTGAEQVDTVRAEQPDNSLWVNDMILKTLTDSNRKAIFKEP